MAEKKKRIFISAAEASGDSHCAGLIKAYKEIDADVDFVGVGGPKMEQAGCELIEKTVEKAAMIYKAFSQVVKYLLLIRRINIYFTQNKVDLAIVCDSPAFNFHIAKAAKKAGVQTLFYVAPQLWAWAPWRIKKLKKYCDKLCCILPFEVEWFGQRGVEAHFVGNPMLDALDKDLSKYKKFYSDYNLQTVHIAIMPGSRDAEIGSLWRPMQQIANQIKSKYPNVTFTAVAVDEKRKDILKSYQILGFRCKYAVGSVNEIAQESDFAIVASGSATLQVASAGCPMVVMYQSSRIMWQLIGRWLVTAKNLSLINIIAQRDLVPEFMPYFDSVKPIVESIIKLLEDQNGLSQLSGELIKLVEPLGKENASQNVVQIVREMLGKS